MITFAASTTYRIGLTMRTLIFFLITIFGISACGGHTAAPEVAPDTASAVPTPQPSAVPATSRYKFGDQLNVLVKAGLVLREKPDATSKKISTIPYGQKVTTLETPGEPFQVEPFSGFIITGNWVKVNVGGKVGFVFDGFLSSLEAPKDNPFENIMKNAKSIGKTSTNPQETSPNESAVWLEEVETFDNGVSVEMQAYEGGSKMIERFPLRLMSLNEAYLLINAFNPKGKWSSGKTDGSIRFESESGLTATIIKKDGTYVTIEDQTAD